MNTTTETRVPHVNLADASRFLDFMAEGEAVTFQTFDDDADRKQPELANILHGDIGECATKLQRLNARGAGVYWMVNFGDGLGRSEPNVTSVRAVFLDLDGAPLQPVLAAGVEPHAVIESSPGKWHIYWLVSGCKLEQFKAVQTALAAKFNGDTSVNDLPRVLRVPGFIHAKRDTKKGLTGEPFRSRIERLEAFQPYDLGKLVQRLQLDLTAKKKERIDPETGEIHDDKPGEHVFAEAVQRLGRKLRSGDGRRAMLKTYIASRSGRGLKADDIKLLIAGIAAGYFDPDDPIDDANIAEVVAHFVARDTAGWPELDPLPDLAEEVPAEFPFDALGPVLGKAARAIAEHVQAPDALAGGSVLAAAAVAAQVHADVIAAHGRRVPLSLFVATSALSGDRKSATDDEACSPINKKKKDQARRHARDLRAWQDAKRAAKPADDVGTMPMQASITVSKGTPEGLHDLLRNQSHIGLFSPEGAELLAGHGMQAERRTAGVAWLLKAWGAEALDDLTRGKGLSVLIGRRVSMHIMVQPIVLQELMADPKAQGQGLIARCLIAAPRTLAGTRKFKKSASLSEHEDVRRYFQKLETLLTRDPVVHEEGDGFELQTRAISMTPAAEALWIEAYDDVEVRQAPGSELAGVTAWASKFGEHAARIAGVIAMANNPDAMVIDDDTMLGAIQVADFYLSEHVRLMGQSVERLHLERLQTLLDFMHERRPRVPHADVLRYVNRPVRKLKAEGINPLLDELTARGYIRRDGDAWEVRPRA